MLNEYVDWYAFIDIRNYAGKFRGYICHCLSHQSRTSNHTQVQWTHRKYFLVFHFLLIFSLIHPLFWLLFHFNLFPALRFSSVCLFVSWILNYNHQKWSIIYYRKLRRKVHATTLIAWFISTFPFFCFVPISHSFYRWRFHLDRIFSFVLWPCSLSLSPIHCNTQYSNYSHKPNNIRFASISDAGSLLYMQYHNRIIKIYINEKSGQNQVIQMHIKCWRSKYSHTQKLQAKKKKQNEIKRVHHHHRW